MLTDSLIASLQQWAANNPRVIRLWVFGGVIKGHVNPKDIDIALDVAPAGDDCCSFISRLFGDECWTTWKEQLSSICQLDADLCHYHASKMNIVGYVAEASRLLYTKPGVEVEAIPGEKCLPTHQMPAAPSHAGST